MPDGASMFPTNDLFTSFARSYDARRETEMSLARISRGLPRRSDDVRERARADPGRDRRAARWSTRRKDARLGRIFMNRTIRVYPGLLRVLRHGGDDRADRRLLPPRRPGAGGAQADPLPARPRRRRQVVARRAPQGADGGASDLRAQGRRRDQPGLREPARPVRPRADGRRRSRTATASRAAG